MPQSLANILIHVIFSTKHREPLIQQDISTKLYQYIAAITRANQSSLHEIGGTPDHLHLLLSLPRTFPLSKLIEEIKKSSSKWIKTTDDTYKNFSWQNGYGAFSIGQSNFNALRKYIQNQLEHHKTVSFQDEYRIFLRNYQITFNEKYLWD